MDSLLEDAAMRAPKSARAAISSDRAAAAAAAGGFDRAAAGFEKLAMTSPDSGVSQDPPTFAKRSPTGRARGADEPALRYYSVRHL